MYNRRFGRVDTKEYPSALPSTSEIAPVSWDSDAMRVAYRQANEKARRDPEAAALLMQHLESVNPATAIDPMAEAEKKLPLRTPSYDAMRILADMQKYYKFGHVEMLRMHYPTFFGYHREMILRQEEERDAYENASHGGNPEAAEAELARQFPKPVGME